MQNAADLSDEELVERARAAPLPGEQLTSSMKCLDDEIDSEGPLDGPHIVVLDCGVKRNIIRSLARRGARVTSVPYGTPFADIAAIASGWRHRLARPGRSGQSGRWLDVVRSCSSNKLPYFGICLGHQLLARAIGADTVKLKFGHRGGNHPVLDARNEHVSITAQNHGYMVRPDSMPTDTRLEGRARSI